MQNFTDIPSTRTLSDSLAEILNNDKTAISASSGTSFPTTNLQLGMPCYRTDQQKLYRLTAVSPSAVWTLEIDFSSGVAVAPQAAQSDGNFTTPLAIEVNSSSDGLRVTQTGTGHAIVVEDSANPDSTPFVIDATGVVINGATSSKSTRISSSSITPAIQQVGATNNNSNIGVFGFNTKPGLLVAKANGTEASPTPVASGNCLARISAAGFDGTNYTEGGSIRLEVDGTPATNSMPGRLVFSTTADGNSAATERMRIDSAGRVTMPYQPSFYAYSNASNFSVSSPGQVFNFNVNVHNNGSHHSAGTFTAPVNGVYQFNAHVLAYAGQSAYISLQKNGSTIAGAQAYTSGTTYDQLEINQAIYLSAGDTVRVWAHYGNFTNGYSAFSGFLHG